MGAKQTKIEGNLPDTPVLQRFSQQKQHFVKNQLPEKTIDPRSPSINCRTPIHLPVITRVDTSSQLVPAGMNQRTSSEGALGMLRKKIFQGLTFNLNDPRSPSLNRTPLTFEDAHEKTLNLDDTFSNLFVEGKEAAPAVVQNKPYQATAETIVQKEKLVSAEDHDVEMVEMLSSDEHSNAMIDSVVDSLEEPLSTPLQQKFDPRSPSIGVERTPIIFNDDDDANDEDEMLENILATLTLNLDSSNASSNISFHSMETVIESSADQQKKNSTNMVNLAQVTATRPTNKHLDRVRCGRKAINNKPGSKRRQKQRLSRQQIYEDKENHNQPPTTPKMEITIGNKNDSLLGNQKQRTPLSCVRNRSHQQRSRSVESSAKTTKTRLPLTSFDDSLNPVENQKVAELRILAQGSQDSLEL